MTPAFHRDETARSQYTERRQSSGPGGDGAPYAVPTVHTAYVKASE